MAITGQSIVIYMDGSMIAGTRSNDMSNECDTLETASPTQGSAREFVADRSTWSVTVNWLLSNVSDLTTLLTVGQSYTLTFVNNSTSAVVLTGSAILKRCQITATRGNLVQGSFVFQGTGSLT